MHKRRGRPRAVAAVGASTGLTTHRLDRRKSAGLVPRLARLDRWSRPEPVCEPHDSTGEPGAGNRHAGFGERGEETYPWVSACGPARKRRKCHRPPTGHAPPLDSTNRQRAGSPPESGALTAIVDSGGRAGFVPENRPHSTCGGRPPPPVGPGRRPLRRGGDRRVGSTFSRAEACAGTARSCPAPPVSVDAGRRARPTRPVMRGCVGRRDSAGASSCRRGGRRGPPRVRPRRRRTGHRRVSAMAVARATIRIGAGRGRARVAAHWRAPLP